MYLDVRTLLVAAIVVCSVLGPLSLAFGPGQPHMQPSRFWGAGLIALACGLALISLREYSPMFVSQVVGQGLVGLALTFAQSSASSISGQGGRERTAWVLLGAFVLALIGLDTMLADAWLRRVLAMGMMGCLCGWVAYAFDRGRGQHEGLALRTIGIVFGLFGLSLILDGALGRAESGVAAEPGVADGVILVGLIAGLLLGTILLLWVMTERIGLRMQQLGSLDPLTGALNRMEFIQYFEREAARAKRLSDSRFAILLIDVDRFRRINGESGHVSADRLLVKMVEILRGMIRQYDLIGRLEGDAFMLLMPGARSEAAASLAERVAGEIKRQASVQAALANPVTVSVSVAVFGEHGDSWDTILQAAHGALKQAKALGGNRVKVAAPAAQAAGSANGKMAEDTTARPH